ncbi:MAG: PhoH family protein [Alistipes senegalensis]|nr:PhoH family protein [Alistipes senegalensis]
MKKTTIVSYDNPPETLDNHPFFGIELNNEQKLLRDAIWDKKKLIIFCNASAGTGKTLISAATANLLVLYHMYNGIVYIASPTQEQKQGYLKGSLEEKSEPYFEPFYQALNKIGVNLSTTTYADIMNEKNGTAYIQCMTHTFLRGCNFENKVVIIDEAQNYYTDELKKTLTRISDSCKVIVIGHTGQIDLYINPQNSGFERYLKHFANDERCAVCTLTENYRGWISTHADELVN